MNNEINAFIQLATLIIMVIILIYSINSNKKHGGSKIYIDRENRKEMETLSKMNKTKLTIPLTEISRPKNFEEIIGQEEGIKALKAALCGGNPQHVIIYGPPGIGKTAAARLVLEYAKTKDKSPFNKESSFIEIDATTLRFDERGIADPLIGSVHDPIYQGAGAYGMAGIPQPKPGAVSKAHGGMLFIDEIGEMHPIEMNKLLKVLEDRRVFFDSSYYNSEDPNIPTYIKEVFDKGFPADFRLIGATTRSPEEITPALRSRCVEVFFRALTREEIERVSENAAYKIGVVLSPEAKAYVGKYSTNGREALNIIQLCAGIADDSERNIITKEDVEWVVENGQYTPRLEYQIGEEPRIGHVNGLAVVGPNIGMIMEIEATATKVNGRKGIIRITGIVEEEEITSHSKKIKRKSMARCSIENVLTALDYVFDIETNSYDIHVNFPGGIPVDGPSAGVTMACAIYSAIRKQYINNNIAMTGELSLHGKVKAIGGVKEKIKAAIDGKASTIIIPKDNYSDKFESLKNVLIIPVENLKEVIEISLIKEKEETISTERNDKSSLVYSTESIEAKGN